MNRRHFLQSALSLSAVSLVTFPELGCTINTQELANLAQTLGNASVNVANLEGNPALAAKLTAATSTAVTSIVNWKSGTATNDVIQAIGILEETLSLFPVIGPYVPLIDLALGTIQTILSLIPPPTVTQVVAARNIRTVHLAHAPKKTADFKKQWNAIVVANPTALAKVTIS